MSKAVKEIPLVIESPQDYEYFTLKQQELISTQLDGARKKNKDRQPFIFSLISQLNTDLMGLQKMYQPMEKELKTLVDVYKIQNPSYLHLLLVQNLYTLIMGLATLSLM